jgi:hypothetical protein
MNFSPKKTAHLVDGMDEPFSQGEAWVELKIL